MKANNQSPVSSKYIIHKQTEISRDKELSKQIQINFPEQKMNLKKHLDEIEKSFSKINMMIKSATFSGNQPDLQQDQIHDGVQEILDLQVEVNELYNYLRQHILSFQYFESQYLPNVQTNGFPQKYDFSNLISFIKVFLKTTNQQIQNKHKNQPYFSSKYASVNMEIPKKEQFDILDKAIVILQYNSKEYEEKITQFNVVNTNEINFTRETFQSIQQCQLQNISFSAQSKKILQKLSNQKYPAYQKYSRNKNHQVISQQSNLQIIAQFDEKYSYKNNSSCNQYKQNDKFMRENKEEIVFKFHRQKTNISNHSLRQRSKNQLRTESFQVNLKFDLEIMNDNIISVKIGKIQDINEQSSPPQYSPCLGQQ